MKTSFIAALLVLLASCASGPPSLPYPAWIDVDDLPDAFVAGLPGARAKQLAGDARTQRGSYRVEVPADWSFTTGASPGHSIEIFVLAGALQLGEFPLAAGGYAWLPAGMPGMSMRSANGALMLYFVDDADPRAVIQTPLISSSHLVDWQQQDIGVALKELRADPGSGARTWLLRLSPEALLDWQKSSQPVEGYLLSGAIDYSECSNGKVVTAAYLPGRYFLRPSGTVHGGPATRTASGATWFLRVAGTETIDTLNGCN